MKRLRVLLINESANPEWPSVPLVGWRHGAALHQLVDAHTVTQIRNRDEILRAGWQEGREFTVIDSEAAARPLYQLGERLRGGAGKGWTTSMAFMAFAYYYFEHLVWKQFGSAIRLGSYDIVHRITPLSPTIPSPIARHCADAGVPFIWGPINGGVPWPDGTDDVRWREREWLSYVRSAYKLLPAYGGTRRFAAAIAVASRATEQQLNSDCHGKCVYIPENGLDDTVLAAPAEKASSPPLRIIFVGRLVPYKGAEIALEAAAPLLAAGQATLDIIGDGPEAESLRNLAQLRELGSGITFHGWLDHDEVLSRMAQAHVLAFPSIREFGGAVVIEAMALGAVPIVVDYAGPAEVVTGGTGFRVPLGPRPVLIGRYREIFEQLLKEPATLAAMAAAGRQRIADYYTWQKKARQTVEVYRWVLGQRPDRPNFGILTD
ncbi:MAG: glycosyltransferase [Candidatus Hydrogenedentes bacterium]|nr:glycosyltransferase [Candidatus Hydrogenedentota bacterium]